MILELIDFQFSIILHKKQCKDTKKYSNKQKKLRRNKLRLNNNIYFHYFYLTTTLVAAVAVRTT